MTNYFETLGVNKNATPEEIKKSYHKLVVKWHPDKFSDKSSEEKEKANGMIREINEAYEKLSKSELVDEDLEDFDNYQEENKKKEEDIKRNQENILRKKIDSVISLINREFINSR
jgi:curved DNA-binding protein CbpA